MLRMATVCSGIGAPEAAAAGLGIETVWQSEIEAFPAAVLALHYPFVPNLGDMCGICGGRWRDDIDILVGGTPCQAFSVAGLRGGLDDPREGGYTGRLIQKKIGYVSVFAQRPGWCVFSLL